MIAALVLAAGLAFVPGPDDPTCEPGQSIEADHCAQGQLPGERIGRVIDGDDGQQWIVIAVDEFGEPIWVPLEPPSAPVTSPGPAPTEPPHELAHTGVQERPYVAAAALLVAGGAGLVLIARRGQAHGR